MAKPKRRLTIKQDRFARQYATSGNGAAAAVAAGYAIKGARQSANRTLTNVDVTEAVQRYRVRVAERLDISREKILNDAAHDAEDAASKGDYNAANTARTLISRIQGYIIDKSVNVSVDVTGQHIQALMDMIGGKREMTAPVSITPQTIDAVEVDAVQPTSQQHSDGSDDD